jgi:hypothetical protein
MTKLGHRPRPDWMLCVLAVVLLGCSNAPNAANDTERETLEKEFAESMNKVVLDGSFTVNRAGETRVRKEKYTIESVSKVGGDIWIFQARIQYGDHDVTVPVPVKLLWAGDTPVVSLTDATIPGLGTFTARVLFYRDSYAGFWSHGEVSGNQYGKILRGEEAAAAMEAEEPQETATPEKAPTSH